MKFLLFNSMNTIQKSLPMLDQILKGKSFWNIFMGGTSGNSTALAPIKQTALTVIKEQQKALTVLKEQQKALTVIKEQQKALTVIKEQQKALTVIKEQQKALTVIKEPQKALMVLKEQQKALTVIKEQQKALTVIKEPQKALMVLKEQQKALMVLKEQQKALTVLPINETSLMILQAFASKGKAGSGWRTIVGSWWFTSLFMAFLYYAFYDISDMFKQPQETITGNKVSLGVIDRIYAYCPYSLTGGALWLTKKVGIFDVDQYIDSEIKGLSELIPTGNSTLEAFKLGVNPGPFYYSFEKSDPSALFKYAMFLLVASDDDWQELITTMAPIPSAGKIIPSLRSELRKALTIPAAGWLAGVGVGFALPLHTGITTLVMGYNAIGAAMAYSKGIADLDRELQKTMPNLHGEVSKKIDAVVANYFDRLSKDYNDFVKSEPPQYA
jgi:hypothetical protein